MCTSLNPLPIFFFFWGGQKCTKAEALKLMFGYRKLTLPHPYCLRVNTEENKSLPEFLLGSPRLALLTALVLMLETAQKRNIDNLLKFILQDTHVKSDVCEEKLALFVSNKCSLLAIIGLQTRTK